MVLDMQERMTDMASSLRVDFQEDASKMLVSLLNNLKQPDSARGADTQTIHLQDFAFEPETLQIDEVMNKINRVTDDLESTTNTLDDLLNQVNRHDEQIRLLMKAAEKPLATTPPANEPDLRAYLDEKMGSLRDELMEGIDIKMADLKNSCDYKIMSVQEHCESQEAHYLSLTELMDSKESDLRNEIQDLKSKLGGEERGQNGNTSRLDTQVVARVENIERCLNISEKTLPGQCFPSVEHPSKENSEALQDLEKTVHDMLASMEDRLSSLLVNTSTNTPAHQSEHSATLDKDTHSILNRFQSLQPQLNVTEAQLTVLEKIAVDSQSCKKYIDALRTTVNLQHHRLGNIETSVVNYSSSFGNLNEELTAVKNHVVRLDDLVTNIVQQQMFASHILNSSWTQGKHRAEHEVRDLLELHRTQHRELMRQLDEVGQEVKAEADGCREKAEDIGKELSRLDSRVVSVEALCSKLEPLSDSLQRIKEGLNKHITSLWTCVSQINGTVTSQARDIGQLRLTCQNLQNHFAEVARDLQLFTNSQPTKNTGKLYTKYSDIHRRDIQRLHNPYFC